MSDEVVTTPFGQFLIDPRDIIGSTLKAGTLWDGPGFLQPIAHEYGRLGEPGVTILDIGANIGSFSVWLAHHGAWRVLAVEPVPETMAYLKANLDLNKDVCADRVIPLEVAAYDQLTHLYTPELDRGNLGGTTLYTMPPLGRLDHSVSAFPLDDFSWTFGSRVSLIKVDTQGCDGAALMGLARTLERDHPALVFEWEADLAERHRYTLEQVQRWLELDFGYQVHEWPSHSHNYLATVPHASR